MKGIYIHISITSITILWSITKFLQEIGNIQHFWNSSKKVIMISIGVILMMLIILMIWIWNRWLKNVIFIRWKLMKVGTAHAFPTLLTDFLKFKKNYPFYPFLILRIILFSSWFVKICLKLGLGVNFSKDRKRIKTAKWWEVKIIVGLVR